MKNSSRIGVIAIVAVALAGCVASREKMMNLEPGMSKEQVVKILGQPDSSRLRRGESCLMYSMWRDFWNRRPGDYSDRYYACFSNDKLTSYGRVGDDF